VEVSDPDAILEGDGTPGRDGTLPVFESAGCHVVRQEVRELLADQRHPVDAERRGHRPVRGPDLPITGHLYNLVRRVVHEQLVLLSCSVLGNDVANPVCEQFEVFLFGDRFLLEVVVDTRTDRLAGNRLVALGSYQNERHVVLRLDPFVQFEPVHRRHLVVADDTVDRPLGEQR